MVGGSAAAVEQRLVEGRLACPGCSGVLAGWGYARERSVRDRGGTWRVRPRRARCGSWGVTHVLLPAGQRPDSPDWLSTRPIRSAPSIQ
jgi:hypothetical protein